MIVLLTDFGESEYVGIMKGVIYSIYPEAHVTDLTHSIPSQSIREGAWILLQSYKYFPPGSVFVSVIDPGVGTARDAVIVATKNYILIGPDNGLLFPAASDDGFERVYKILIDERDRFMARRLSELSKLYPENKILAVVGAGHVKGINKYLTKETFK